MVPAPNPIRLHVHKPYAIQIRTGLSACSEAADLCSTGLQIELPTGNAIFGLDSADPHTLNDLQPGETMLGIGPAGGLDLILAAETVGPNGRV